MITVNCSSCKAKLEMDDAFAGGVCRCHYCGTIQTVPAAAKLKRAAAAKAAAQAPVAAGNGRAAGSGVQSPAPGRTEASPPPSGLDALAEVVASSGLSRGGLAGGPPATRAPAGAGAGAQPAAPLPGVDYATPGQQKTKFTPLVLVLGVIALLLGALVVLVVGYLFVGTSRTTTVAFPPGPAPVTGGSGSDGGETSVEPAPGGDGGGDGGAAVQVPKTPHFCGIPLDRAPSVVYVLDRGQATADLFDTLKEATYRSIESLKPGTKFQIIFWDNGTDRVAYPAEGLAEVSAKEIEAAREKLADVIASGQAKPEAAVRKAAESKPAAIVLVTGKAFYLEESVVQAVQDAVAGTTTKVHTVALKSDDGNSVMKDIAQKTHAEYRVLSARELREYSE